jgi:hypothetical protein
MFNKKSQALAEMGIFAALILCAFTFLIAILQRMDGDQYELMGNFRRNLKKSHDENKIVSYTTLNDEDGSDYSSPAKDRILASASSHVHWAVPKQQNSIETQQNDVGGMETWTDTDKENDPERKYYALVTKPGGQSGAKNEHGPQYGEEEELNADNDIQRVERRYTLTSQSSITRSESESTITFNRSGSSSDQRTYILVGQKDISTTHDGQGNSSWTIDKRNWKSSQE